MTDFRKLYKNDVGLIKPDDAFNEELLNIKPRKRVIKTRYIAVAAAFAVLVIANAVRMFNFKSHESGAVAGGETIPETTFAGDAAADGGRNAAVKPSNTEAAEFIEDEIVEDYEANAESGYTVISKDDISEIRLYDDGRLEIIINGESRWFIPQ